MDKKSAALRGAWRLQDARAPKGCQPWSLIEALERKAVWGGQWQPAIDQSSVGAIGPGRDDATNAQTVISLGHSLGIRVIAEGVDRPIPAAEFTLLLQKKEDAAIAV